MNTNTCKFEGCERDRRAKGYCASHYRQIQRGVGLRPLAYRYPKNWELSQESLKELFDYKDGHLIWKKQAVIHAPGTRFGTMHKEGYIQGTIHRKTYYEHRLIWLYMTGEMPLNNLVIHHKDGNRNNNNWDNLILATVKENNHARGNAIIENDDGTFDIAIITKNKFDTLDEATKAYTEIKDIIEGM